MASPRPVPRPSGLVVKNGSNRWARTVGRYPGSVVGDAQVDPLGVGLESNLDASVTIQRVVGIVQKVRDHLIDLVTVAVNAQGLGGQLGGELHACRLLPP